ncbi:MAG TPA: hypothetical protein VN731_10035 [Rhodanobacter sp.]|nr:hypothetical protein [Rhodanobacter sp.]
MALNPVTQGTLNRLRAAVIVPSFPSLNVTSPYMGKSFVHVTPKGRFNNLIPTATGAVTSPEPYVEADITFMLLRTQSLGASWRSQWELQSTIGQVNVIPDSIAWASVTLDTCVIGEVDFGAYDGTDPMIKVTMSGIYYINSALWSV